MIREVVVGKVLKVLDMLDKFLLSYIFSFRFSLGGVIL